MRLDWLYAVLDDAAVDGEIQAYLDALVSLGDAVGPLGDLHQLQLIDHGFFALHAVADYHGRELEFEKADAFGLTVS